MMFCVTIAAPFCVLPTKDSIEEVRNRKFTSKDNVCWTIILTTICCAISCAFENITLPIQLLGATTNSAIGFLLPICYYLKMEKRTSPWTNMKIMCYLVSGFICISSVIELVTIFIKIAHGTDWLNFNIKERILSQFQLTKAGVDICQEYDDEWNAMRHDGATDMDDLFRNSVSTQLFLCYN